MVTELLHLSIAELRKQFLSKSLLPISVLRLNIFVTVCPELATRQAKEADQRYLEDRHHGALDGACPAVKDNFCTKDVKTSCGSLMLDNFTAPYTATIVQKCYDKGAVMVGKTNLDVLQWVAALLIHMSAPPNQEHLRRQCPL